MKAFKHQQTSIKFMSKVPTVFDMSDPGTGKTYVQIMSYAARRKKNGGKALVLAPKSLLDSAWKNDIRKFAPYLKVLCAYANNREQVFKENVDIYITNHDAVKWLVKQKPTFFKDFDTIIVDESSAYKHHTSQRSKALAKLTKHFTYRSMMSGTPTSNGVTDLWHQVYLLDGGKRLGDSFFKFRAAACLPQQVSPSANIVKWVDRPGIETVVSELVKDITVRHKFEDCVDIPPNFRYAVPFNLTARHMAAYKEMEADQMLLIKDKAITAVNGAVVYTKLLQIASGAVYDGEGSYALVDTSRYELILDLVEARKHSIVFFNWDHQRELLALEAEKRGLSYTLIDGSVDHKKRTMAVEEFQAGKHQVMFAHPQSAGHGLTLIKGTATIWASPTYNLEHFLQGLKRVHRIGQTEKTETVVVVAEGTIDEKVWAVLQEKDAKQGDLLEMLKL